MLSPGTALQMRKLIYNSVTWHPKLYVELNLKLEQVVINLELKQVDTKESLAMKGYVFL